MVRIISSLMLGSKPSVALAAAKDLAATNSATTSNLQILQTAGTIPQRASSMEGWMDLV